MFKTALLTSLVAVTSAVFLNEGPSDRQSLVNGYRNWKLATTKPQDMSPAMMLSCIGPTKWDSPPNPHAPRIFVVFVNRAGEKAMLAKGRVEFPDGTVIVKEKYKRSSITGSPDYRHIEHDATKLKGKGPELMTVMAKRNGKWEYFALDPKGKVIEGDTEYCASCHKGNAENDHVFRPYVEGAATAPRVWR